jgi:hypothetical protein
MNVWKLLERPGLRCRFGSIRKLQDRIPATARHPRAAVRRADGGQILLSDRSIPALPAISIACGAFRSLPRPRTDRPRGESHLFVNSFAKVDRQVRRYKSR